MLISLDKKICLEANFMYAFTKNTKNLLFLCFFYNTTFSNLIKFLVNKNFILCFHVERRSGRKSAIMYALLFFSLL